MVADAFDQLALQSPAVSTGFGKPCGNDDQRFHANRGAIVDDADELYGVL